MIFWILGGLTILIAIAFWVAVSNVDGTSEGIYAAMTMFLVGGIITAIVCGFGADAELRESAALQKQATYELKALQTQENQSTVSTGSFFLGFGYYTSGDAVDQVINYIQISADGGATMQGAPLEESVIYEGDHTEPYVEVWATHEETTGTFWVPWHIDLVEAPYEYRFYVPTGSIIGGYEVSL